MALLWRGDSGAERDIGGQHRVQYKFIDKGLKGATKLLGKLCYFTRPVQEDYFEYVLKLLGRVSLILLKSYFCMTLIIFLGISSIHPLESVSVISPMNSSPGEVSLYSCRKQDSENSGSILAKGSMLSPTLPKCSNAQP